MAKDARSDLEALIAQIALGNKPAFERLYDATSGKLLAVCLRVLRDRAAAEDAMQDTYVKVWNSASKFNVTGHSPMTWLITIARNTAIDHLRTLKPKDDISNYEDRIASRVATPEQTVLASSEAERILACLEELEQNRRDAIKGAYLDGQSYKDLSDRFDVPLNTMRTWLRRGLASLRGCMSR